MPPDERRTSETRASTRRAPLRRLLAIRLGEWAGALALGVAAIIAVRTWVVTPYRVPSSSMEPTLHCARPWPGCEVSTADRLLVGRFIYWLRAPHRGDIVVFKAPLGASRVCGRGIYVKRIIGLPGEVVSERHGVIYIDGRPLKEPYIARGRRDAVTHTWPRLRASTYFVLGDNRRDSCDSRWWGPLARGDLVGPVIGRYWPLSRLSVDG